MTVPPTVAYYRPPPPTTLRSILSIIWILAIAGFLVLVLINFTALFISPSLVIPGIQGVTRGGDANPGLDASAANWSFQPYTGSATGSWVAMGGNSGGYLQMNLGSGTATGYWTQAVAFTGSAPYEAAFRTDVAVQTSSAALVGRLVVALDTLPGPPDFANTTTTLTVAWINGSSNWVSTNEVDLSSLTGDPGTYYLKVAFIANSPSGSTTVGLDNVRLAWVTAEGVLIWLPLPLPTLLFLTQDPVAFLTYYLLLVVAIMAAGVYFTLGEWKRLKAAFAAPLADISHRLRSMSAWVAIAQTWMAVTFVQVAIIIALEFANQPITSPIGTPTAATAWGLLYELANASVYEELVFRLLLIGVPMALASLLYNAMRPPGMGKSARHSLRYIVGGSLRKESSPQALLAAWILLFASGTLFGLAHAPGWGWWKVVPALVAGLGFGYLFLRHGIGAAILAHFATDYASVLTYEGVGGATGDALTSVLFVVLTLIGFGFLLWYILYAWQHLEDMVRRLRSQRVCRAVPAAYGGATMNPYYPPPSPPPTPPAPAPASPPSSLPYTPPPTPPPGWGAPATAPPVRNPAAIPQEYAPTYRAPPYGYPPVRFQCPYCGWVEAKYDAGHFTCLRCGRTT